MAQTKIQNHFKCDCSMAKMKSFILLVLCLICDFVCADKVLGQPYNATVERISDSSLQFKWEAPLGTKWHDDIAYNIEIDSSDAQISLEHSYHQSNCPNLQCSFKMSGFPPNVTVFAKVHAYDQSEHQELVRCKAVSTGELHISWGRGEEMKMLVAVHDSYNVTYAPSHQFYSEEKLNHLTVRVNELVLNGLKAGTNYSINLVALAWDGFGVQSTTFHCATEEDVPDEPVDVKVVLYTTRWAFVMWHAPLKTNGDILYYTIYYRKKGSKKTEKGNTLASKPIYEIVGLESNQLYEVWVTATNKAGEGRSSKYVTITPSSRTPAKIAGLNKTITAKVNEEYVKLNCDAVGLPVPTIVWKVNGDNLISHGRFLKLYTGTLYIKNIIREDAKNYTCIATNEYGSDSVTYELIVQDLPKSPEVTILSTTTDEITVQLKPNSTDSAPNHGFKLFYKSNFEIEHYKEVTLNSSNTQTYRITDCKCGSSYQIYASGYNDLGDGEKSEILTVNTNGSKPIAPKMSEFIEPSAEGVTLHLSSWKADSISHFFVEFKEKTCIDWIKSRNKLRPNTNFVLDLKAATMYDIRVTAHNSAGSTVVDYEFSTSIDHAEKEDHSPGPSDAQSPTSIKSTEEDVPDEPADIKVVVYDTQKVLVLWQEPLQTNGEIVHYTIYYRKKGSEAKSERVLPHKSSYEIFGLETNETYEFWVTASTKAGEGLASKYVTATPGNETPAKIASFNKKTTKVKGKFVTLPCDLVGSPFPYLRWKVNGENLLPNERFTFLYTGSLYIQDIIREDANNYTCKAMNEYGSDSITYELIVQDLEAPEVTILSTTTDEITVQLKPNSDNAAPIHGFKLFYKLDSEIETYKEVTINSSHTQSYRISDCKCGSSYRIYARGYNDLGEGDYSEILSVNTNGSKPIAPTKSDFLEPSAKAVTLHLSSWNANDCPISYFFVEFKEKTNVDWVKIHNKIRPNTDFVLNLKEVALYDIRVTAHNPAGTTVADYECATSNIK